MMYNKTGEGEREGGGKRGGGDEREGRRVGGGRERERKNKEMELSSTHAK